MSRILTGAGGRYAGLIHRYRDRLPVADDERVISLGEGATPLIRLGNIAREYGRGCDIYVKYEGLNPTGSFKDRGMTVAVTRAVNDGSRAILCASTGNTSASAAAYAARAGIRAFVLIPDGKIALGKLAQAVMHGAEVIQIRGNFDDGMRLVRELAATEPVTLVNSVNPYRLQGQKTAAFEVVDDLGRAPDYHCLPVGNAGNISAYWMGYCEYHADGLIARRPRMVGYQAAGAAPFVRGGPVARPETVATAIRIGNPQSWDKAKAAQEDSGGWFAAFDDEAILAAQRLLAEREGIFCEPASAVSVAGALHDIAEGRIRPGSVVVCTLTGHGLKDPDIAVSQAAGRLRTVDATLEAVREAIVGQLA
ncbi:threonine synthase [Inmirania thermothiophila]|uniref:Threonine synthase n=1 Tax=Inmirania thermothiophila TaxID=1750597 RepID=A0A3N1XZW0_9GAMM|nr:threonine synthase [Inmirania thermothiophila]ROR32109.1 L-threonine synthase [Inmirania thermothiophila]